MTAPIEPTGSEAPAAPAHADPLPGAESASHFTEPSRLLETEVARQGLGDAAVPAPVRTPLAGEPRGGGYPIDSQLGVLARLRGSWNGNGFNLIARPAFQRKETFFLELNATTEHLRFTPISSPIPNRGSQQDDISFLGLTYLQQVTETGGGALHIEPGIWLNVPATTAPPAAASLVRLATIPHGSSLLAQGSGHEIKGAPTISAVSSTPLDAKTHEPVRLEGYDEPFIDAKPPPGIPAAAVLNPNLVLTEAIASQTISETIVLLVSTKPMGGIENIPFLKTNADAISMSAIFWIETVQLPDGATMLQLQYTQTVLLSFDGIIWPHISVATLLKF